MSETELKPCPFCGNTAVVVFGREDDRERTGYRRIVCLGNCGMGSERAHADDQIETLKKNWNRRHRTRTRSRPGCSPPPTRCRMPLQGHRTGEESRNV